ncbi:hypothetical protein [Tropicimonas sp. S265A]|uniref:hypothetical protein n=1 Tax=Tropicimonas sp. S265A TaxID=3415134 RepID=UPI003C7A4CAA
MAIDPASTPPSAIESFEPLFTAEEAFPAFERLWLNAEMRIEGCFRIFDLRTKLRSPEARLIGETWFDLIVHCLDRGVSIDLTISDFDPVVGTEYHRLSWASARQLAAAAELAKHGNLTYSIALHPARVGSLPRLLLYPKLRQKLYERDEDLLTPGVSERKTALRSTHRASNASPKAFRF